MSSTVPLNALWLIFVFLEFFFLTMNLSIAFSKTNLSNETKNLEYYRPAYIGLTLVWFLAHLSWKLKWDILKTCPAFCLSFRLFVCIYIYTCLSVDLLHFWIGANINQTWHKAFLAMGIQVCKNEEPISLSTRGD